VSLPGSLGTREVNIDEEVDKADLASKPGAAGGERHLLRAVEVVVWALSDDLAALRVGVPALSRG